MSALGPSVALSFAALLALIALTALGRLVLRRRLRRKLKAQWGAAGRATPEGDILQDLSGYWRTRHAFEKTPSAVDDTTWRDLDMDEVFGRLNATRSVVGSEALYALLRETNLAQSALRRRAARVEAFARNERLRLDVQMALEKINKSHFHGAPRYLYEAGFTVPARWPIYFLLAGATALSLLASLFWPPLLFVMFTLYSINVIIYLRTQFKWRAEAGAVKHISSLLNCARALAKLDAPELREELDALRGWTRALSRVRGWCPLFAMEPQGNLDVLTDYVKILFLLDMVSLSAITRGIVKHSDALRGLYALVGELDADIAIAEERARVQDWCAPEFSESAAVEGVNLCHPLLERPVPNTFRWTRSTLITGSNASGKSTFSKAVAVNCILAQTTLTCRAARLVLPRAEVLSSMAIRDSLLGGESYFVAELRSLKRILDAAQSGKICLCFVDEILRGTNTVERIAASSSVLLRLSEARALCMTATHDIELTQILKGRVDNWHFREEATGEGIEFTYKLQDGPATSRNAIALLGRMGYPKTVVESARACAAHFEKEGRWPEARGE